MEKERNFLVNIWSYFFSFSPTGMLALDMFEDFLAPRAFSHLKEIKPYDGGSQFVYLDDLISTLNSDDDVDSSFKTSIDGIKKNWYRLRPEGKSQIKDMIKVLKFNDHFHDLPDLTFNEAEAAKIRWDIADILYAEEKEIAFTNCLNSGIDLKNIAFKKNYINWEINSAIEECEGYIFSLLKKKIKIDLAVVFDSVGDSKTEYLSEIRTRALDENRDLQYDIHQAIMSGQEGNIPFHNDITRLQKPFEKECLRLIDKIPSLHPESSIVNQINKISGGDNVSQFTITGNGNIVGDNNMVITKINSELENKLSTKVAEAFALLKAEVVKSESLNEKNKRKAIRALENAEDESIEDEINHKTLESELKNFKRILEESGEIYDKTEKWGSRFSKLGKLLTQTLSHDWPWLSGII